MAIHWHRKTSPDDYHNWKDFLRFDRENQSLVLVKRVDENTEYRPGSLGDTTPRLFPAERFSSATSKVSPAKISFVNEDADGLVGHCFSPLVFFWQLRYTIGK